MTKRSRKAALAAQQTSVEQVRTTATGRKLLFARHDSRHPATYLPALDGRFPLQT